MCLTCCSSYSRSIRKVAPEGRRNLNEADGNSRDKRNINGHIHIHFEDVLGEPGFDTETNSYDCVWISSYLCYNCCKNFFYRLASLIVAFPVSFFFGFLACSSAFCHIWAITPFHRCMELTCCHCLRALNGQFMGCLIGPIAKSFGEIFWAFRRGPSRGGKAGPKPKGVSFNKTVKYKTIPSRKSNLNIRP